MNFSKDVDKVTTWPPVRTDFVTRAVAKFAGHGDTGVEAAIKAAAQNATHTSAGSFHFSESLETADDHDRGIELEYRCCCLQDLVRASQFGQVSPLTFLAVWGCCQGSAAFSESLASGGDGRRAVLPGGESDSRRSRHPRPSPSAQLRG